MRSVLFGLVLSLACLVACSGDDGPGRGAAAAGVTGSGTAGGGDSGKGGRAGAATGTAGSGATSSGGASGTAGDVQSGGRGGQTSVGKPDGGSGVPGGMVEKPEYPSGLLAHTTQGCVIAMDDSLKCWKAPPFVMLDELMTLPGPGQYDAVYIEQSANGLPFRCAHLAAGGYGCDTLNSWRAPSAGREYVQLAFGSEQSCGLLASGEVECWDATGATDAPEGTFVQIDALRERQCGLRADGTAVCWVNDGSFDEMPAGKPLRQLSVGVPFSCGLDLESHVVCWGTLGDAVLPTATARQVEAANDHACALFEDGRAECFSQLPAAEFGSFQLPSSDARFRELSASDNTVCGISADAGEVWCWGRAQAYARVMDLAGQPLIARSP